MKNLNAEITISQKIERTTTDNLTKDTSLSSKTPHTQEQSNKNQPKTLKSKWSFCFLCFGTVISAFIMLAFVLFPTIVAQQSAVNDIYFATYGDLKLSQPAQKTPQIAKILEDYLEKNYKKWEDFLSPKNKEITIEDVEIPHVKFQHDNGKPFILRGWFVKANKPNEISEINPNLKTVILTHPAFSDRRCMLKHAQYFARIGLNSVLYDSTDHGASDYLKSKGHRGISLGIRETQDFKSVVNFLKKNPEKYGSQFISLGSSQGGYVALLGTVLDGMNELVIENPKSSEKSICLAISENPFSNRKIQMYDSIASVLKGDGGWDKILENSPIARNLMKMRNLIPESYMWYLSYFVDFVKFGEMNFFEKVPELDTNLKYLLNYPVFLIHSTKDNLVLVKHSKRIIDFLKSKESEDSDKFQFWETDFGYHTFIHDFKPQEFEKRVIEFVKKHANCK